MPSADLPGPNDNFSTKFWPKIKLVEIDSSHDVGLQDELGRWS